MYSLFGQPEKEVRISQGMLEGSITFYEKGFVYEGPGVIGKVYSYYHYIERIEKLESLPLGQVGVRMIFFSTLGERFDVRFAINEHYFYELKERSTRRE